MWYRRNFEIPAAWKGKRILLHFDAIDHNATVFINGQKAGSHAGGYDGFSLDITSFTHPGVNIVVVGAHDTNDDVPLPVKMAHGEIIPLLPVSGKLFG